MARSLALMIWAEGLAAVQCSQTHRMHICPHPYHRTSAMSHFRVHPAAASSPATTAAVTARALACMSCARLRLGSLPTCLMLLMIAVHLFGTAQFVFVGSRLVTVQANVSGTLQYSLVKSSSTSTTAVLTWRTPLHGLQARCHRPVDLDCRHSQHAPCCMRNRRPLPYCKVPSSSENCCAECPDRCEDPCALPASMRSCAPVACHAAVTRT